MAHYIYSSAGSDTQIVDLVMSEREKSLSIRELRHRLAGYGYAIRKTDRGGVVESLAHGRRLCALPESFVF